MTMMTMMSRLFLCLSADGGHAERLPERPVLHQQWDPDSAAAVGQHERAAEEQAGGAQPPQSAGGRAGGARRHDLVSVMESRETVKCSVGLFAWRLTVSSQHHPGQSSDGAGVPGAAPRTQQQDQLRQRAELQRDAGLLRHPGHRRPPQTQGDTRQNNPGTCTLSRFSLMWSDLNICVSLQAVSKIREFILQKIYSFRKPMTNYQIPQNTLLKYRWVHCTCRPSAPPLYWSSLFEDFQDNDCSQLHFMIRHRNYHWSCRFLFLRCISFVIKCIRMELQYLLCLSSRVIRSFMV